MTRSIRTLGVLGLAAATSVIHAGCGSDTRCGTGTVLTGGQCVPDGSVICSQGTAFDPASGRCVVDPTACAEGTVLVGGECVPDDATLTADLEEAAEPNDDTGAGQLDVPAPGAPITLHGCITPRNGEADRDAWTLTTTGPALLEIEADGVGGLAAGFAVATGIARLPGYQRFGLNLTGDTSRRQVYLPLAGDYTLLMDDSRALLSGAAAGGADTCYYTTLKQVALPTPITPTLPQTAGEDSGDVTLYRYTPGAEGDILDISENTASEAMRAAFVVRKNGVFHATASSGGSAGIPAFSTVGGLAATDEIDVIVDSVFNYGITPQAYTLDLFDIAATALPRDGSAINLTKKNGEHPAAPHVDDDYSYFDVADGEIVQLDLSSSVTVTMHVVRPDVFDPAGNRATIATLGTRDAFTGQYLRFRQAGRYYLVTRDPTGAAGDTYTLTATLTSIVPNPVTHGTALTAQPLPPGGSGFHTLALASQDWIELGLTGTDWGAGNAARVSLYDLAGEGWLTSSTGSAGANYPAVQAGTQPPDGTAPIGRITRGDSRDYLVRIEDSGVPGGAPAYDLLVRDRPHVALGAVAAGSPIVRTDADPTAPGATTRYLLTGVAGTQLSARVTPTDPTVDIAVARRDVDESIPVGGTFDTGGPGAAETLGARFGAAGDWIAFTVSNNGATTTHLSLDVTATEPIPFVDVCATGTVLPAPFDGSADDQYSAVLSLPGGFAFSFFGVPQTDFIVGANGFLAFGSTLPTCSFGCYSNGAIPGPTPTSPPNNFIAAYWDDLENVQVCRKDEAGSVTIQWTGDLYGSSTDVVQVQAVLNSSGRIDIVFGPDQTATGSSATVGAEDSTGTVGIELTRNVAGGTPASSSYSFVTPAP